MFPSPVGELHFSIQSPVSSNLMTCFRPLSGNYISQLKKEEQRAINAKFPSPVGELHFSISY